MKVFIKIVLGNLVALILFGFVGVAFFGATIAALLSAEEAPKVEPGSTLVFDMSANLADAPPSADFWQAFEEAMGTTTPPTYSLRAVTDAIRAAAGDERISSLFLHGNFIPQNYGSGFSALRELRLALLEFKESGKPIVAYVEVPTVRGYYVSSVADKVMINPYGMVGLSGLASQQFFVAGALDKLGVGVQVVQVGRYKSAVEMFTQQEMSEASRAQTIELLDDLWGEILTSIGESRGLSVEELQDLADRYGYIQPEDAFEHGLVDGVAYMDQVLDELRQITGASPEAYFPQVEMDTYSGLVEQPKGGRRASGRIAVIYLEGDIVDGEGTFGTVGGDRFAREIRRLRLMNDISAMVVRVNSPGGSVSAAEVIQREISLAREKMPVVFSFGSFAASGGYWVATDSDRIFAQPNTITGSIGVFGILPNFQELAHSLGVTFDQVKTAKFADTLSLARPKTEEELEVIQGLVDQIYEDFLNRVAQGRNMPVEEVRGLAEGRVWSGKEARRHGLVDEIGGLAEAIAFAAGESELETWKLYEFPRPKEFAEALAELFAPEHQPLMMRHPLQDFLHEVRAEYQTLRFMNDPRGLYVRLPFFLRIQ